jgi:dCMP deaminase
MSRKSWARYFMGIVEAVSERGTCPRKTVGCVITRDSQILATGYNGSLPGVPHCEDEGCTMVDGHCVATIHAEANAVAQAAKNAIRLDGATAYVTCTPCLTCSKLLVSAGIGMIIYGEDYRDDEVGELLCKWEVPLVRFVD